MDVLTVAKMAHGGEGIIFDGGRAMFVPFVIPGEKVRVRSLPSQNPPRAELGEVVEPSPHRVDPPCPYFSVCGGCSFQHIEYSRQLEIKGEVLADCLSRIGKVSCEVSPAVPSPLAFGYRSRLKFQARRGALGFFARSTNRLVEVDDCLLAMPALSAALPALRELSRGESADTVEVALSGERVAAYLRDGRRVKSFILEGPSFTAMDAPPVFSQVNPAANLELKRLVSGALAGASGAALELYAGAGNLTGPLLEAGLAVTAAEVDRHAVAAARKLLGGPNPRFLRMDARTAVDVMIKEDARPSVVLVDPPRSGAKEVVPGIIRLAAPRVIYVSCDPATLARDARALIAGGYKIISATPLDMFPQTHHLETVACFDLDWAGA